MELLDELPDGTFTVLAVVVLFFGGVSAIHYMTAEEPAADGEKELTQIDLGYVPAPLNSPHYIAKEEGFYEEQGLDVRFHEMSGPEIGKAVANGELEVGSSATTPAVYQARADLPIKLVAARAGYTPEQDAVFMMVRDGLNFSSVEDFKGKTLCTETSGSMDELFFYIWADRNDIDIEEDIDYTYTSEESWESAFASGSVDACVLSEPGKTYLQRKDLAHVYKSVGGEKSAYRTAFVALRSDYLKENPETAKRFLTAYAKAAEYARENPEERIKYVSEYTDISEEVLNEASISSVPPVSELEVNTTLINMVQDDMDRYGLIEEQYEIEPMVDNTYIREVQQELE